MKFKADLLWKYLFSYYAYDFVRVHYPELYKELDLTFAPEHLDKELINYCGDVAADHKIADKLVKFKTNDGEFAYIYLHIEIQAQEDKNMPKRMYEYYTRIVIGLKSDNVFSVIFLVDPNPNYNPNTYQHHFPKTKTKLTFEYDTIKVMNLPDQMLVNKTDALTMFYLITKRALNRAKDSDFEQMRWKRDLLTEAKKRNVSKIMLTIMLNYIKYCVNFSKEDAIAELDELIKKNFKDYNMGVYNGFDELLTEAEQQEWLQKGIEEGKKKGIEEGKKKGIEEGKKKGIEEGKKKGIEEGKKEGIEEATIKHIQGALKKDVKIEDIAYLFEVPEQYVRDIQSGKISLD